MKNKFISLFLSILIYLVTTRLVQAKLTLNEIYPAPLSGGEEWIELYNDEPSIIDISGFFIEDLAGNKIKINLNELSGFSFAVTTSKNVLNNGGDTVYLKNNSGEIVEQVTYSDQFDPKSTYAKCPDGEGLWFALDKTTRGYSNQEACNIQIPTGQIATPTAKPTDTPLSSPTLNPPTGKPTATAEPVSYESIYISEAMVYPESGQAEWVEIYNDNDFDVYLDLWYLDDVENSGSSPKTFSLAISTKDFSVFELSSPIFNNGGDFVRLLDRQKQEKDSFEYEQALKGKSFGRESFNKQAFCLQEQSRGKVNNPCLNQDKLVLSPSSAKTPTPTKLTATSTKTPTNPQPTDEKQTAEVILGLKDIIKPEGTTTPWPKKKVSYATTEVTVAAPLVKSLSISSFFISLLNIGYILRKIVNKVNKSKA